MKKQAMKKNDKEYDRLVADISKMDKSLAGLYEQSCALLKPTIDDACRNPSSYSEKEIEMRFGSTSTAKRKCMVTKMTRSDRGTDLIVGVELLE